MFDKESAEKYISRPITKLLNSSFILNIYPMIEHIDAYDIREARMLILRIYVNDSEMNKENMYQRELDPHYLIDFHLKKYSPYFNIPQDYRFAFVVVGTDGNIIHNGMD